MGAQDFGQGHHLHHAYIQNQDQWITSQLKRQGPILKDQHLEELDPTTKRDKLLHPVFMWNSIPHDPEGKLSTRIDEQLTFY